MTFSVVVQPAIAGGNCRQNGHGQQQIAVAGHNPAQFSAAELFGTLSNSTKTRVI